MNQREENADELLETIELEKRLSAIKHQIIVLSGKGGVGKSTTAANLAVALALHGRQVGLLDIDFHGPSIPKLMGLENRKAIIENDLLMPLKFSDNLKVMSLGLLLIGADDAVIWRGPMKMGAIKQLLKDVNWGELDYLIIDCPPGTGDEPLSIVQLLKNPTGAVVVTQPQALSVADVRRSVRFCEKLDLPVLGIIENMSGFVCPHCGQVTELFKTGGGARLADSMNVPFLGKIPFDPSIVDSGDNGQPFVYLHAQTEAAKQFDIIGQTLIDTIEKNAQEHRMEQLQPEPQNHRFAIPTANGELCRHFGHCEQFTIIDFDLSSGRVMAQKMVTPPPHEPGKLPRWLHEQSVQTILAGGMGAHAQNLFAELGIHVVTGVEPGKPEALVSAYSKGELVLGDNSCDH